MGEKHRRSQRRPLDLEHLRDDPDSFLSWGMDDPALRKLETYRLYRAGFAVADIALAFGFSRSYLHEMWSKFKAEGTRALVDKRWGAPPRKRTTDREAAVLRAKAVNPERGDTDLAREFGMERSTIYRLLNEHGLQDLHRVLEGSPESEGSSTSPEAVAREGEKKGSK